MSFQLTENDLLPIKSGAVDRLREQHYKLSLRGYNLKDMLHDTVSFTRAEAEVRCACVIPGGVQCVKQMGHGEDHKYETRAGECVRFSTHINAACLAVEFES
jgi:hypothetical protein